MLNNQLSNSSIPLAFAKITAKQVVVHLSAPLTDRQDRTLLRTELVAKERLARHARGQQASATAGEVQMSFRLLLLDRSLRILVADELLVVASGDHALLFLVTCTYAREPQKMHRPPSPAHLCTGLGRHTSGSAPRLALRSARVSAAASRSAWPQGLIINVTNFHALSEAICQPKVLSSPFTSFPSASCPRPGSLLR